MRSKMYIIYDLQMDKNTKKPIALKILQSEEYLIHTTPVDDQMSSEAKVRHMSENY